MKVRLIREYDGEQPIVLGTVTLNRDQSQSDIKELWEEFRETESDTDDDFIDFLRDRGFAAELDMVEDIVLQ